MMGNPEAAYDLPLETQTRLLGWLTARAELHTPKAPKPKGNLDMSFSSFGGKR